MEGKTHFGTVITGVLILCLVLAQTQVEAFKACCPTIAARNCFKACCMAPAAYARRCSCIIIRPSIFPRAYPWTSLESSADNVYHYCKLGCASSMCSNLQNSVASEEVVNADVLEQCTNACSAFYTKGSTIALESA